MMEDGCERGDVASCVMLRGSLLAGRVLSLFPKEQRAKLTLAVVALSLTPLCWLVLVVGAYKLGR